MNYLGHLLVSGDDPLVITGNFMADAVKGRDLSVHLPRVQQGIRLHRTIDVFTDNHAITLTGRERLREHCGKYAGVALDVLYDHCIATTWKMLHDEPLPQFTDRIYTLLTAHADLMPERTRMMLPYMVRGNWLGSYASVQGVAQVLDGMSRRVPAGIRLRGAEVILLQHYDEFIAECSSFLRDLRIHLQREER
jgi:acyl carrier protein phosphodiesterase